MRRVPVERAIALYRCRLCASVCQKDPIQPDNCHCPRCHTRVTGRQSIDLHVSSALLVTAIIFYIPANVLPVMSTTLFGQSQENTILSGVCDFWRSGSFGIALLIFIASVVIPCLKFFALGGLLLAAGCKSTVARRERTVLWRMTEWIGYWSMLDVVVVAVVSSAVRFQGVSEAMPREGIFYFALVVILTLCSALSFTPRWIWKE